MSLIGNEEALKKLDKYERALDAILLAGVQNSLKYMYDPEFHAVVTIAKNALVDETKYSRIPLKEHPSQ